MFSGQMCGAVLRGEQNSPQAGPQVIGYLVDRLDRIWIENDDSAIERAVRRGHLPGAHAAYNLVANQLVVRLRHGNKGIINLQHDGSSALGCGTLGIR